MTLWNEARLVHPPVTSAEHPNGSETARPKPRQQPEDSPTPPERGSGPQPGLERMAWHWSVVVAMLGLSLWLWRAGAATAQPTVDYSVFFHWLEAGRVQSVVLSERTLEGALVSPENIAGRATSSFRTVLPDSDVALLPVLRDKQVVIRVADDAQPLAVELVLALLPWAVLIGVFTWSARRARATMPTAGPLAGFLKSKSRRFEKSTSVNVVFDDLAGLTTAKRDLQEVVQFLKHPEHFQKLGGKVPRGVLLVGPPGTGKTLLARAVAGESGVPFFSISASEFIELFVGVGAARVRDLFEEAKKSAPAIIFIDELDAVGRSRGAGYGGGHDEREQTLNQLLSEMDGFDRHDLIIVLAATNRPDVLDPALLRPGRFDRRVLLERPELAARRAILAVHVRKKPLDRDVDLDALARTTPGFSGADLANLVNEAALNATRRGADAIAASDFSEAYDKIVLGDAREGKLSPGEMQRVAVHESGHTVVARFSGETELPRRVTIIPRGMALGASQQTISEDRHISTQPQLESQLRVLLGGYAAERLVFGSISTGAENDLKEATHLASKMVAHYGMSETLGPAYYEHDLEHPFLGQKLATDGGVSDATTHAIERETRDALRRALDGASRLLAEHRRELDRLVQALLDQETIEGDALKALLGGSDEVAPSASVVPPTSAPDHPPAAGA
jgi:cell division protease FtsH